MIAPTDELHIRAVAEALFNYEPRNSAKRWSDAHYDTQARYIDRAAWVLSQAYKALRGAP